MTPKDHWTAVLLASELKKKPVKIVMNGSAIALFRSNDKIAAVSDRCPHRMAEFSNGRVVNGDIECPYHGWRFNASGQCTAIPGYLDNIPRYRIQNFTARERDGVIFISPGTPQTGPYTHGFQSRKTITRLVHSQTRSTVIDAAENILDATHTHFTHKGLLRGLGTKRHRVTVEVTGAPGRVEACYTGEPQQDGFVSKLLEGGRSKTIGRFLYPGIAELEYWGPKGLVLVTSFHLYQSTNETVNGIGWLVGPHNGPGSWLRAAFFKPLFHIALEQDKRVLKSAQKNAIVHGQPTIINGPLDFLRQDIEAIMAQKMPPAAATPRSYHIEL